MNACNTKEVGTEVCLPLGNITFVMLPTLCNHLGTEDINCCSFASGIVAHSWCIQDLSCSTVRGCRCLILLFMMRYTFSIGDRAGLQAGQSSTRSLCLQSHDVVTCVEWGLALSCWNRHGVPGKSLRNNGTFTYMQIIHAVGTYGPPYHHRGWFFHFLLVTVWMISHLQHVESDLNCGLKMWPENTFPLSFSPSQRTSSPENFGAISVNKCLPLCKIFNLITFYLYSAFYNARLSQSSFTKGTSLRPPQSKPRATVARKNSITRRNLEQNQASEEPVCFWPALGKFYGFSDSVWILTRT